MGKRFRGEKKKNFIVLKMIALLLFLAILTIAGILVLFPIKYNDIVGLYAAQFDLDAQLVHAVIHTESRFDPYARSPKNAKGLMQITDQTGEWAALELNLGVYTQEMLFEPETNIMIGCWYLRRLLNQYGQNEDVALAAYNAGSGNVSRWLGDSAYSKDGETLSAIPYKETQNYLIRVKRARRYYEIIAKIPR